jgi:hypothetical protein
MKDGVLCKKWEGDTDRDVFWQVLVPKLLKEEILRMAHDHPTAGHLGEHKTMFNIRKIFFWCGYRQDVEFWCKTCEKCAKRKNPPRKNIAPLASAGVGMPMERVHLDILGPLPKSSRGHKYILVVVDWFTKWTEAYPMTNQEAETCTRIFVEQFVCRFGTPKQLHSDQGTQFESHLFQEMAKMLHIDKTRTTPLHPMSNGLVERSNRTIENMLSLYVSENQKDWD